MTKQGKHPTAPLRGSPIAAAGEQEAFPETRIAPFPTSVCPVANRVAMQVLARAEKGFKKYDRTCARTDLTPIEWLQHLQEELLDAAVYIEAFKRRLGKRKSGNRVLNEPGSDK